MAEKRGRRSASGFLGDYWQPSGESPPVDGQPNMPRMQGVPTLPGYRDRIPKWNAFVPPIILLAEMIRDLLDRIGS